MATKQSRAYRRRTKRKTRKQQKQKQKVLRKKIPSLKLLVPSLPTNYSPIPSPGTPNTNSPLTLRAKELARLYPTQRAMLNRSTSFNGTEMTNEEFYERLGKEIGFENKPYFPEDHLTER